MVFDLSILNIYQNKSQKHNWSNTVYSSVIDGKFNKDSPPVIPEPTRDRFIMRVFVDSDHAGNQITRSLGNPEQVSFFF